MLIVFEGIDGSGKTTISNRVAAALAQEGTSVKHLRAEGKFVSPVVEGIREFGRNAQNLDLSWQAEFLLYVARDVQLIHEALLPALAAHDLVLADRFLYTPEVLGRHGRHLPEELMRPILDAAAGGLQPDLVILVDVDPAFARARRKLRKLGEHQAKPPARKGLSGAGLQQRLRNGYLALAASQPERWVVLENEDVLERSVERALELIRHAQREGAPRAVAHFRDHAARSKPAQAPLHTPQAALSAFLRVVDGLVEREPRVAAYLLGGMFGPGIDERRAQLFEQAPDAVLAGLRHLSDPLSVELRRRGGAEHPAFALRSLGLALASGAGWQLWQDLFERAPAEAIIALSGSDDERAWQARERTFASDAALREVVVGSLGGLASERAWQLRERLRDERQSELKTSYDLARVLAKSVTGLGGERAWELRRATRAQAPVAALMSLLGVTDAESWQWRRALLHKAPKVVMASLRGSLEEQAWQMRNTVAADCKEALDGLQGVDAAPAWSLRESHADVWPSTVVKSLGAVADGERGRRLLTRQLQTHPANVSLLKHAAAIALGLHRGASLYDSE
ncbi:MAG TPA: dTMP kinase [Polyangiaceae bacterium]|nr:dTMP kinase [Polyangiaceae bacterium]